MKPRSDPCCPLAGLPVHLVTACMHDDRELDGRVPDTQLLWWLLHIVAHRADPRYLVSAYSCMTLYGMGPEACHKHGTA